MNRARRVTGAIAGVWLLGVAITSPAHAASGWEARLERIAQRQDRLASVLEAERVALLAAADAASDEAARRRLAGRRTTPERAGWGLVPALVEPAEPPPPPTPTLTRYDLAAVEANLDRLERQPAAATSPLAAAIDRFEARLAQFRLVEAHHAYHRLWQPAFRRPPPAGRNGPLRAALDAALAQRGRDRAAGDRALATLAAAQGRLTPSADLALTVGADGRLTLPLPLCTDVDDSGFHAGLLAAVERLVNQSAAARDLHFRLALELRPVPPPSQADGTPPRPGQAIDLDRHLAGFARGCRVLTTGAPSTHVRNGRALILGPKALAPRTLVHELLHLLGFTDTYVRVAYPGASDAEPLLFVEASGLGDDLLASSDAGTFTRELAGRLIAACAPR